MHISFCRVTRTSFFVVCTKGRGFGYLPETLTRCCFACFLGLPFGLLLSFRGDGLDWYRLKYCNELL